MSQKTKTAHSALPDFSRLTQPANFQPFEHRTKYRYDSAGNITNLYSTNLYSVSGVTNLYQVDSLSRLTNVLANGAQAAGYGFDVVGNLQSLNFANGITNRYSYDSLNRLTNLANTKATFFYQLGAAGNRTNLFENLNGTARTYSWAYDSLYRLTNETFAGGTAGTVGYNFDLVSNRTNRNSSVAGVTNQSFAFTSNDWLSTDSYDSNGSTTVSGTNSYSYDPLCHMTNANGVIFGYDGDGNRVRKTVNGTNIFYLRDDRNPTGYAQTLEEWTVASGATNLARVYNFGLALITQKQGSTVYYFGQDGHSSTRLLFDSAGNVVNAFAFDAYGILIASTTTPQTSYLYCGEYQDPDTGEYYLRARWLMVGTGRFATMDTFEGQQTESSSLHKYLYCSADAINRVDHSGYEGDVLTEDFVESQEFAIEAADATGKAGVGVNAISRVLQAAALSAFLADQAGLFDSNPQTKIEKIKKDNPNDMVFLHATSTGAWPELAQGGIPIIDPTKGLGKDFGRGFYTYNASSADARVLSSAIEWANQAASEEGGAPVVTIWLIKRTKFSALTSANFYTSSCNPIFASH